MWLSDTILGFLSTRPSSDGDGDGDGDEDEKKTKKKGEEDEATQQLWQVDLVTLEVAQITVSQSAIAYVVD